MLMLRDRVPGAVLEALESRQLLAAVFPTPAEQFAIELINRARLDPVAEAARFGIDLNEGPPSEFLSPEPRQPLAVNPFLMDAARSHAQWMSINGLIRQLPHEEIDGTPGFTGVLPQDRAATAGFTGGLAGFENQAFSSGASLSVSSADRHHTLLFKDFTSSFEVIGRGHRVNMLRANLNEIGLGLATGGGDTVGVHDFAAGDKTFLTGVIFADLNGNDFYTPGEGIGGITITAHREGGGTFETTTWAAGGYTLEVPDGTYHIIATGDGFDAMEVDGVVVSGQNQKVDFIAAALPPPPPPDIVAHSLEVITTGTLVPGDKVTVRLTLRNDGGQATGPFAIKLFRSSDNVLDQDIDVVAAQFNVASLAGGATRAQNLTFALPPDTDPQAFFLIVQADATGVVAESDETNNVVASAGSLDVQWLTGSFDGRRNVRLVVLDDAGVPVTFRLKGPGFATITSTPAGFDVALTQTNLTSTLTIATPKGMESAVRDMTADSHVKAILARTMDLTGDITLAGATTRIQFDDVADQHTITIGAPDPALPRPPLATLIFDEVDELSVVSETALKAVIATAWRDRDGTADRIEAPAVLALRIKGDAKRGIAGDFEADVLAGAGVAGNGKSINKVLVAGTIRNATIAGAANVGAVTAGRTENAGVFAGTAAPPGSLPANLAGFGDFNLKAVTLKGIAGAGPSFVNSNLGAMSITRVKLRDVAELNDDTDFGVITGSLKLLTRLDDDGSVVKLAQPPAGETADNNFKVRIV